MATATVYSSSQANFGSISVSGNTVYISGNSLSGYRTWYFSGSGNNFRSPQGGTGYVTYKVTSYNTPILLQWTTDGSNWTTFATLTGTGGGTATFPVGSNPASYSFRVYISNGSGGGYYTPVNSVDITNVYISENYNYFPNTVGLAGTTGLRIYTGNLFNGSAGTLGVPSTATSGVVTLGDSTTIASYTAKVCLLYTGCSQ